MTRRGRTDVEPHRRIVESHRRLVESHRRLVESLRRRRRRRERVGFDPSRGSGPAVVRPRGSDVHRRRLRATRGRHARSERRRRVPGGRGGRGGYRGVGRTTFGAAVGCSWMPRVAVRFVAAAVVDEGCHPLQVRAPARASPRAALRRGHVGLARFGRTPFSFDRPGTLAATARRPRVGACGYRRGDGLSRRMRARLGG